MWVKDQRMKTVMPMRDEMNNERIRFQAFNVALIGATINVEEVRVKSMVILSNLVEMAIHICWLSCLD